MNAPDRYWQETRRLTFGLLLIWAVLTFVINWFAPELNHLSFLGFPLGFYMAAQGELLLFLALIWYYNRRMDALEKAYGLEDEPGKP